mgnify:CR=1 FL=1
MKTYNVFKEYIWLVNVIRRAGKISLADINRKWRDSELSEGVDIARTTFNRHKAAIEDMFGIIIECDAKDGYQYYIANPEVLRENSVQNWILSTLSVSNVVSESLSLQDRILMESAPVEGDLLKDVIGAMKEGVKLELEHKRYDADESKIYLIEPYCIKLFKHRWYVLGKIRKPATDSNSERAYLTLFSFDRIKSLHVTKETFEMDPLFDAESYFSDSYGVLKQSNKPAQRIVLRAFDHQRHYLKDLPIHHSQRQCGEGPNWTDFEYWMCSTSDLMAQLLTYGSYVKVLEPQHLADEVKQAHLEAVQRYLEESQSD